MKNLGKAIVFTLAVIWLVIDVYPLIFMVFVSMKSSKEYLSESIWALPDAFDLTNYVEVMKSGFYIYYLNSVFIVAISIVVLILAATMASYAFGKLRFKMNAPLYTLFMAGMMIPVHVTLIPIFRITNLIGLYNTRIGLVGPYVAFGLPVSIFLLTTFMAQVPNELEEAAIIDGANKWQRFAKIAVPISIPAINSVMIYNIVHYWNEFVYALILINDPDKRNVNLGLWAFYGDHQVDVPNVLAALALSVLPLIVTYIFLQQKIVKGMIAGSVKE